MEGISALLLSLCLSVNVSCNNVEVSFDDLKRNIISKTIFHNSGSVAIFVDDDVRLESKRIKEVLVYELTRIEMYRDLETNTRSRFKSKCMNIAKKADIGLLASYDLCST
jgi:hypothetical protein